MGGTSFLASLYLRRHSSYLPSRFMRSINSDRAVGDCFIQSLVLLQWICNTMCWAILKSLSYHLFKESSVMALSPCRDCEELISDNTDWCPNCGCHNPHFVPMSALEAKWFYGVCIVALVVLLSIGAYGLWVTRDY